MHDSHSTSSKIDRLSLPNLPPELLRIIFDHLDFEWLRPFADPLCRALLPHVRRNLYRRVSLHTPKRLTSFFATVHRNPELGSLVRRFEAAYVRYEEDCPDFDTFLQTFASTTGSIPPSNLSLSFYLPNLTSLGCSYPIISCRKIIDLAKLKNLTELEISFDYWEPFSPSNPPPPMSKLKTLKLHASNGAMLADSWTAEAARFVTLCPTLSKLILSDGTSGPSYGPFLSLLSDKTATSLTSLTLLNDTYVDEEPCDDRLFRFINLETLIFEEGTVSASLPTNLRQLPRLSYLHLDRFTHDSDFSFRELADLVSGPNRMPALQHIGLDCFSEDTGVGKQVDVGDSLPDVDELELGQDGWEWEELEGTTRDDIRGLLEAAEKHKVSISGAVWDQLETWNLMQLEKANRVILRAFRSKSLAGYRLAQATNLYPRLPDINVKRLDLTRLKLVKIDLPEEEWFQFTLE
ncbi:hypothetical protein JCM16303_000080 [Sporobolomyces ruberrimus]